MKIYVELREKELKQLVYNYIQDKCEFPVKPEEIKIRVKTSQNYQGEWETGQFKAVLDKII